MVKEIEAIVQVQLVEHPYNTVGSFLKFYDAYRQHPWLSVDEFFRLYNPPITPEHHTCVGLSLDLVDRIKKSPLLLTQPRLLAAIFLASCEEEYGPDVSTYMADGVPEAEEALKEHVVVALRVRIGGRYGAMVLDTGYHIARAVTAMEDGARPHTGWFVQSQTAKATKRYNYSLSKNRQYVLWEVVEQRGGQVKVQPTSLIYIQRRFVNAVDVVERRNLVYDFKVWMARDSSGSLMAGFYFPFRANGAFTLYLNGLGEREECKIPVGYFSNASNINNNFELAIARCDGFMRRWCGKGGLREILVKIAFIVADEPFLCSALNLNRLIEET